MCAGCLGARQNITSGSRRGVGRTMAQEHPGDVSVRVVPDAVSDVVSDAVPVAGASGAGSDMVTVGPAGFFLASARCRAMAERWRLRSISRHIRA